MLVNIHLKKEERSFFDNYVKTSDKGLEQR